MSKVDKVINGVEFDSYDHQKSYVFAPSGSPEARSLRPKKRRKISRQWEAAEDTPTQKSQVQFPSLLNDLESSSCIDARHRLFDESWGYTEAKIQSILHEANETTLAEVTTFVEGALSTEERDQIPTALIVTGPNIASQELLFTQLAGGLKSYVHGPVVILRSGDASNFKTILKKVIRDATNQKDDESEDLQVAMRNGRKLLNYDLQILHDHLQTSGQAKVVVAFQDSEAFDSNLLGEVIDLFSSWLDRIPFVVLFGIATSVELFHERLPRGAIRCLQGTQFDVEQTNETLEKIFQKAVASCEAPLLLGHGIVTLLLERQQDHVQSLQAFINALKYGYMCHFYANPLSIFLTYLLDSEEFLFEVQSEHMEAIRNLPSFRRKIEVLVKEHHIEEARQLLDSDEALHEEIRRRMKCKKEFVIKMQQVMHVYHTVASGSAYRTDRMDLYVKAFSGQLKDSDMLKDLIGSIQTMSPGEILTLTETVLEKISSGDPETDLAGWTESAEDFIENISRIQLEVQNVQNHAKAANTPLRSKYNTQDRVLRTTVVAQKVHLSKEKSSLSALDMSYSDLLDELTDLLAGYLKFENPLDQFLHEIWIYDSKSPYREVFTPKPRHALERALSVPHDYLGCACCKASEEGLSSSQPPTAILYQLYLETGSLINVFDLWSAFYTIVGGEDGAHCDERNALVLFYKALADLKLLGMVKQSRKKTDHLAKLAWRGL